MLTPKPLFIPFCFLQFVFLYSINLSWSPLFFYCCLLFCLLSCPSSLSPYFPFLTSPPLFLFYIVPLFLLSLGVFWPIIQCSLLTHYRSCSLLLLPSYCLLSTFSSYTFSLLCFILAGVFSSFLYLTSLLCSPHLSTPSFPITRLFPIAWRFCPFLFQWFKHVLLFHLFWRGLFYSLLTTQYHFEPSQFSFLPCHLQYFAFTLYRSNHTAWLDLSVLSQWLTFKLVIFLPKFICIFTNNFFTNFPFLSPYSSDCASFDFLFLLSLSLSFHFITFHAYDGYSAFHFCF